MLFFKVWNEEHDFAGYVQADTAEEARQRFARSWKMAPGTVQWVP